MKHVDDIIAAMGGNAAVARGIGQKPSTISEMRRRNSIPVRHWAKLIAHADSCGVSLTVDMLMALHTESAS